MRYCIDRCDCGSGGGPSGPCPNWRVSRGNRHGGQTPLWICTSFAECWKWLDAQKASYLSEVPD